VYKKVVKFSFQQQKIFGVLVFSLMYLVSVDPMDRSNILKNISKSSMLMAVWIFFFTAVPTAPNSAELNIRFIDSCIQIK